MGGEHVGRVLVVCETPQRANALAGVLARGGFTADPAEAVEAGCSRLRSEPYDVVVAELSAERSVLALVRQAVVAIPPIRVVCLLPQTANGARAEWSSVREAAFACLPATTDASEVLSSVRSALDAHRSRNSIGGRHAVRRRAVGAGPPASGRGATWK